MKPILQMMACTLAFTLTACGQPSAKVIIKVVDESGQPIHDAEAGVTFEQPYAVNDPVRLENAIGKTDTNGLYEITGRTSGYVFWGASKPGYYSYKGEPLAFFNRTLRGWEPWGSTNVAVLKEVLNPVALVVRERELIPPVFDQPCGFDIRAGDWVAPHGQGTTADLIVEHSAEQRAKDDFDYRYTVRFPNPLDGLIPFETPRFTGSRLRSAHEAPANGYQTEWISTRSRRPDQSEKNNRNEDRNFYLRVRTQVDEKGRIKSAHYGKIYGDFPRVVIFLNPAANDRNIEYKPSEDNGTDPF
jgi:hypothetical protein